MIELLDQTIFYWLKGNQKEKKTSLKNGKKNENKRYYILPACKHKVSLTIGHQIH